MKETGNRIGTGPLRIAAIQFAQSPEDTGRVPELLRSGGFNVEQLLHAVGKEGYGFYRKEEHEELIRGYARECARRGISIILYENAHMIRRETFSQHPGWAQIGADGKPAPAYGTYMLACMNSGWRDSFLQSVRDALEQDISGIFLDGPLFLAEGCRCGACSRLFSERFGHPIESASRRELLSFKSEHVARFVRDVREVIRQSGKNVALYANCIGLAENTTGCDIDAVFPYVDLIGSEGGFLFYGDPNEVSVWRGAQCAKYLESKSRGKPYVVFNAGNHQPWARHMHTKAEVSQLFGSVVANGGNVWFGIHGTIDEFDSPAGREAFRFNRFLAKNEPVFRGTAQYADAALLWSRDTVNTFPENVAESDFTRAEEKAVPESAGSFQKEFFGISDMLFRCHRQFSIIDETCVRDGGLDRFPTLILPNASCLGGETLAAVRRYVENGGSLIATLSSGMFDETGRKRAENPLHELFGIQSVEETLDYEAGCGYLTLEGKGPSAPSAGFASRVFRCSYREGVKTLASSYFPMEGRYSAFEERKFPSVTVNRFGKGRAAYIAGGIGSTYADYGILDMRDIFDGLVERFTQSDLRVENAWPSVEVELRLQPGRPVRLLHFANHTAFMQRPAEDLIECRGIRVSLRTGSPVARVRTLFYPSELPFRETDGRVEFSVDVRDYELVEVELR